jgi:hypothetical protein
MGSDVIVVVVAVCAGAAALVLVLGLTSWAQRDRPGSGPGPADLDPADLDPADPEPAEPPLPEQVRELAEHASAAAGRAERTAAGVDAARLAYDEAEAHRDGIGARYDAAQLAYAEALRAVRDNQPAPPTPVQEARRREVDGAALAAYRRGELSVDELRAVFARTGDRDAGQEALEQEAQRLAAREGELRRGYDIAVAAARVAGERLHIAEVAAAATVQEAVDAAVEAQLAADELARQGGRG